MTTDADARYQKYRTLESEIRDLGKQAYAAMVAAFPIGSYVYYYHGQRIRTVMVVGHGSFWWARELVVEGTRSRYRIRAERVATNMSDLIA